MSCSISIRNVLRIVLVEVMSINIRIHSGCPSLWIVDVLRLFIGLCVVVVLVVVVVVAVPSLLTLLLFKLCDLLLERNRLRRASHKRSNLLRVIEVRPVQELLSILLVHDLALSRVLVHSTNLTHSPALVPLHRIDVHIVPDLQVSESSVWL